MSATFSWSVATPEGTAASGECEFLVVPTSGGELGVLADHAALVASVVPGVLRVTESASPKADSASGGAPSASGGAVRTVSVGAGVVDVRDNRVRLLVTRAAEGGTAVGAPSA
ncbi:MAG: F0F1 ATP synthase subunit epsilon [Spirochaetia bacterium]|jgi:F-type H+-transporting ATPase subunit epsilon